MGGGVRINAFWGFLGFPLSFLSVLYYFYKYCSLEKATLKDKVVLITGASSGLGAACARAFYKSGCKVIISGRDIDKLKLLKVQMEKSSQPGVEHHSPAIVTLDLEDIPSIRSKVSEAIAAFGQIDILINNAGKSYRGVALDTKIEVDEMLMKVNYFGHVEVTRAVLPQMISRRSGHIVAISSVQGRIALPHRSAYTASKHALQAHCDSLRAEVAQHGVLVSVVNPYYIATNSSVNAVTADGSTHGKLDDSTRTGLSPDYVASQVVSVVVNKMSEVTVAPLHVHMAIAIRTMSPWLFFKIMEFRAKKDRKIMNKNK